ncbi:hypothetical protein Tco_0768206 [Tanacetum coccineum]
MQEVFLFYNGLDVPSRQILDSRGAIPSKTAADAKVAIQEMVEYSQKCHNGTSRTRSPIHKDCPLKDEGKTLEEATILNLVHLFKEGDIEQLLRVLPKEQGNHCIPERKAILWKETAKKIYGGIGKKT